MCRVQGYLESCPEFHCYTLQNPVEVILSFNCKHLLHIIANLISVFLYVYSIKVPKVLILWGTSVHCTTIMSTQNKTGDTSTYYSTYILALPSFLEFITLWEGFAYVPRLQSKRSGQRIASLPFLVSQPYNIFRYFISSIFVSGIPNNKLFPPNGPLNIDLCPHLLLLFSIMANLVTYFTLCSLYFVSIYHEEWHTNIKYLNKILC